MTIPRSPADAAALVADLIGKPRAAGATAPDARDCWGLVAEVQSRVFGRDLPEAAARVDAARPRDVIEAIRASALHRRWLPVSRPRPGDLVLMGRRDDPVHVGIWVCVPGAEGCLHAVRGHGVVLQSLAQPRAGWLNIGFRPRR